MAGSCHCIHTHTLTHIYSVATSIGYYGTDARWWSAESEQWKWRTYTEAHLSAFAHVLTAWLDSCLQYSHPAGLLWWREWEQAQVKCFNICRLIHSSLSFFFFFLYKHLITGSLVWTRSFVLCVEDKHATKLRYLNHTCLLLSWATLSLLTCDFHTWINMLPSPAFTHPST